MIKYQFVRPGSIAPDDLAANEYWFDVGGKLTTQVFDHHFKDSEFTSTAEIIQSLLPELARENDIQDDLTFVLHQKPDLDGIFSSLLYQHASAPHNNIDQEACRELAALVNQHDQGFEDKYKVEDSWPIIFYQELNNRLTTRNDIDRVKIGHSLIAETVSLMKTGESLQAAAGKVLSRKNNNYLLLMKDAFVADKTTAKIFRISLSITGKDNEFKELAAIALINPTTGYLLKHFARRDNTEDSHYRGFSLVVVSTDAESGSSAEKRWRHVISVRPEDNVNLEGLGRKLELAEQIKEDDLQLPLVEGRERISDGTGRFGWNLSAPWYDGRGHNYTIIDSPAVTISGKDIICSVLTPEEVLSIVTSDTNIVGR